MKNLIIAAIASSLLLANLASALDYSVEPGKPVKIIFDTDMGNDVDDALALAMLHSLQNRGESELLAVTLTYPTPDAGQFVAAVNTFYGRPNIPIGVTPDAPVAVPESKYLKVAAYKDSKGKLLYPAKFNAAKAPKSVDLIRRVLASAGDREIVMVQVGFSTNLARLLESGPDAISPLSGKELVRQKVKILSIMAGQFPQDTRNKKKPEFNVRWDVPAARKLVAGWPTPIVWSGFEIGKAVLYPAWSIDNDYRYVKNHPVQQAYQAYNPTPHERPCWDLTSVAYAVWPGKDRGYFTLSPAGNVEFGPDGHTKFVADKNGNNYYLIVDAVQAARLREVLAALASEPPQKK
ncbi:inosine-uridine nucleoside N-ribohydrolase [Ereboglobus sp. PH5-10]|uniref:nucleoside hydrolase n=1 Tax=Ereboglobus sp. PH5-10 TaxID=2940629 RepID=UPI002406FC03|nr:nucleoside hydrolase [Ereboglobus sp. PH5-10]MDF9827628.1 inosine-uridine nucleoside N-ribohydrolase [Ereboglobus sp. PH5-10]